MYGFGFKSVGFRGSGMCFGVWGLGFRASGFKGSGFRGAIGVR